MPTAKNVVKKLVLVRETVRELNIRSGVRTGQGSDTGSQSVSRSHGQSTTLSGHDSAAGSGIDTSDPTDLSIIHKPSGQVQGPG